MPVFTQQPIEIKQNKPKGIPQETIDEYTEYIGKVRKGNEGLFEFGEDENINVARRALKEAGIQSKKYIRVAKVRGKDNVLKFVRISKEEFDTAQEAAAARGAKLKGRKRGPRTKSES
jgi:nicotinamide mononucleotide adenylyltransferase